MYEFRDSPRFSCRPHTNNKLFSCRSYTLPSLYIRFFSTLLSRCLPFFFYHLPPSTCHLPPATCHLPPATCHFIPFRFIVLPITFEIHCLPPIFLHLLVFSTTPSSNLNMRREMAPWPQIAVFYPDPPCASFHSPIPSSSPSFSSPVFVMVVWRR